MLPRGRLYDVSLPIFPGMITYPGNPEVQLEKIASPPKDRYTLSSLAMGTHTGTHVDAPLHFLEGGRDVEEIEPSRFIGPCRVIDLSEKESEIDKGDLLGEGVRRERILLIKTRNSIRGFERFSSDFIGLTPEAAQYLSETGIQTVGIDALSVERRGTEKRAHQILLSQNILIFEGLDLREIEEGKYYFCGLPLRVRGADGAPARVFLIAPES